MAPAAVKDVILGTTMTRSEDPKKRILLLLLVEPAVWATTAGIAMAEDMLWPLTQTGFIDVEVAAKHTNFMLLAVQAMQ